MASLSSLLGQLLLEGASAGGQYLLDFVRRKRKEQAAAEDDAARPSWKDVEHMRAQEKRATAFKVRKP